MRIIVAAVFSWWLALAFSAGLVAHEGHAHKVMGTVKVVDAVHLEMETREVEKVLVQLNEETKYRRGKAPATAADVKVGDRVVVTLVEKEARKTAVEVLLAPATQESRPTDTGSTQP